MYLLMMAQEENILEVLNPLGIQFDPHNSLENLLNKVTLEQLVEK